MLILIDKGIVPGYFIIGRTSISAVKDAVAVIRHSLLGSIQDSVATSVGITPLSTRDTCINTNSSGILRDVNVCRIIF